MNFQILFSIYKRQFIFCKMTIQDFKNNYLRDTTKITLRGRNEFVSISNREFLIKAHMIGNFKMNKKPIIKK